MVRLKLVTLLFVASFLPVGNAHADTSGLVKITRDETGIVSLPIRGTDAFWMVLNQCYLDAYGYSQSGAIEYRPHKYGDIFFMQQYSGNPGVFAEQVFYMKLAGVEGCYDSKDDFLQVPTEHGGKSKQQIYRERLVATVTPLKAALAIEDVYERVSAANPTFSLPMFLKRIPTDPNQPCPSDFSNIDNLAQCLDISQIHDQVEDTYVTLNKYPAPRITTEFRTTNYAVRKPFSTFTAKTGLTWVEGENTAATTAYISVYPLVNLVQGESWSRLDRFSLDLGLVIAPVGNTASERFKSADKQYLAGLGYDFHESFSVQFSYIVSHHTDGHDEEDFGIGVSLDLLNLIAEVGN